MRIEPHHWGQSRQQAHVASTKDVADHLSAFAFAGNLSSMVHMAGPRRNE